jgi:predicted site-specific integrase-resolvase
MLTQAEIARRLNISVATVKVWGHRGLLPRHIYNDKHECLYEPPGEHPPVKMQGRRLSNRRSRTLLSDHTNEVQYEA